MAGRPRVRGHGLPPRVIERSGTFYFVRPSDGRWVNLGRDRMRLDVQLRELEAGPLDVSTCGLEGIDAARLAGFAHELYRKARGRALQKRIPFTITPQVVLDLLSGSGGRCALTGIEFSAEKAGKRALQAWMPSIDRIDAAKGYEPGNVRMVCTAVNIALSDLGDEVLLTIAKALASRSNIQ